MPLNLTQFKNILLSVGSTRLDDHNYLLVLSFTLGLEIYSTVFSTYLYAQDCAYICGYKQAKLSGSHLFQAQEHGLWT